MTKERPEKKEGLVGEIKEYADIRLDEFKLNATKSLSSVFSQVLSMFLVLALLVILLGLLSIALLQWLNNIFGKPVGTLIVAGIIALLLIVMFVVRKRLFHRMFTKMFTGAFGISDAQDLEKASEDVKRRRALAERNLDRRYRQAQNFLNPVSAISSFVGNKGFMGGFYLVTTLASRIFRKKKRK